MNRVLTQHNNVIAVDFRREPTVELKFKSEVLYTDGLIMVTRTTASLDGQELVVMHFMGNLSTGQTVNL